jgi:nicotinate-nucleotide adenylyltransferase
MINDRQLDTLRASVMASMSDFRFNHTAEVEKMAVRLGELYAPEKLNELRAAALLHDITKELSTAEQIELCNKRGIALSSCELQSPKTLHPITASAIIPERYPEFADEEIISAVRWHTTGRAEMSLCEKLIYLADYIDMSRKFADCIALREYFFGAEPEKMSASERLEHLDRTLVLSFDKTICGLVSEGAAISPDTIDARNHIILKLKSK